MIVSNSCKRIINSLAPIRICDNGVMTDTWFAEYGKVFNIGVSPHAEVQVKVYPYDCQDNKIIINAENYHERYTPRIDSQTWDRYPLLEATIERMKVPRDIALAMLAQTQNN